MIPVAKHGDPQIGVDIHLCVVPPSPSPVPLPTPHMSVVFDPMDYVPFFGATVTVCGMKRAVAGTAGQTVHIPPGFPFAPKLPDKDDEIFMGSATVVADGDPLSFLGVPVLACQAVGMPSPPRPKRKGGPRVMTLPTVSNLAIPTNVFVGGPPTISLMGMAFKLGFAGLGKLGKTKWAQGLAERFRDWRKAKFGHLNPGFLKCGILRAEPVNIVTGAVSVEQEDFTLPGLIPIRWTRRYASDATRQGACGVGWETPADARLERDPESGVVIFRDMQGGSAIFPALPQVAGEGGAVLELMDGALLLDGGEDWQVRTKEDLIYLFPKGRATRAADGGEEYPLGQVADLCGNTLAYERSLGRLVAIRDGPGRRIEIEHADTGLIRRVSLHLAESGFRHVFVEYEQDAAGDLVEVRDALGHSYRFAYQQHRMLRHTDRNGLSFHYEYAVADDAWRVVRAWGDGGLYAYRFAYLDAANERRVTDSLGHVSVITLDDRGLPIMELDPLGGMTLYEYDEAARTTAVVDQERCRTEFEYDARGNLLRLTLPSGATILREFDETNHEVAVTDPNGAVWRRTWDDRGLPVTKESPLGHAARYAHDGAGQLVELTDARGGTTRVGYDGLGNLAWLVDATGQRTRFIHDALGRLLERKDALGRRTRFRYDALGRLTGTALPSGATLSRAYDAEGNLVAFTDESGAVTRMEYAGQGELAARIQPDGYRVEYLRDTEERLVGVRNQRGEVYGLSRDALGRVVSETDYWGQVRRYAFDAAGRLRSSTDPLGRRVDFVCDPLGRVLRKSMPDPHGGPEPFVESYLYDPVGNLLEVKNPHVAVTRAFDPEGRLLSEEQAQKDGPAFTVRNAFDEMDNRTARVTGGDAVARVEVAYAHDLRDRLIGVRIDGGDPIRIRRDGAGQVVEEVLAPGLARHSRYDADGFLVEQQLGAGPGLLHLHYEYDRTGNLLRRRDSGIGTDTYAYDAMGRLLRHTDPRNRTEDFAPDPAGDRLTTRWAGDPGAGTARRDGTHGGATYSFDRAGNLVSRDGPDGLLHLEWDANQRLVASHRTVNGECRSTRYGYDPLGRRLFKETAGERTWFGWDGEVQVAEAAGGQSRTLVHAGNGFEPLAAVLAAPDGSRTVLFFQNDPNGAPRRMLDRQGRVRWSEGGLPTGHFPTGPPVDNRIRFQGQYEDPETGLYYNRARYFIPELESFAGGDPLGLLPGENTYRYAPNTLSFIDPLGLKCQAARMQELVDQAVREIRANPKLAQDLMSPGSYRHLVDKTNLYNASFGKAVERRTAQLVAEDPHLRKTISHTGLSRGPGGQFVSSPDFTSKGGAIYDVTTNAGVPAHADRYGAGSPVKYLTYDVIPGLGF